jgi:hypothetical protein
MSFSMADIISINKKLQEVQDRRDDAEHRRKVTAARNVLYKSRGGSLCEKCHQDLTRDKVDRTQRNPKVPYDFCEVCAEEYSDYIARLQGEGDLDCYWRNEVWMETWKRWIDYRGTMDYYARTKEFRQLIEELRQPDPYL